MRFTSKFEGCVCVCDLYLHNSRVVVILLTGNSTSTKCFFCSGALNLNAGLFTNASNEVVPRKSMIGMFPKNLLK